MAIICTTAQGVVWGCAWFIFIFIFTRKQKIEDKKHQIIKESYLKIMSLYGEFLKLEFLINEARCPFGELDNKKPL